ncbi:unnamed protein product [Lampetra planeri]
MSCPSRRRNPPATSDNEEVKNILGEEDASEAVAAPVEAEQRQLQQPECPLTQAPLVAEGWERLESQIDCLMDAVFQLVLQLGEKEGRDNFKSASERKLRQAGYSQLDEMALNSLVMEKMLALVHEFAVVLPIVEEEAQTFVWVARCLRAQKMNPSGGTNRRGPRKRRLHLLPNL